MSKCIRKRILPQTPSIDSNDVCNIFMKAVYMQSSVLLRSNDIGMRQAAVYMQTSKLTFRMIHALRQIRRKALRQIRRKANTKNSKLTLRMIIVTLYEEEHRKINIGNRKIFPSK